MLPPTTKTPPSIKGESELLRMDIRRPAQHPEQAAVDLVLEQAGDADEPVSITGREDHPE